MIANPIVLDEIRKEWQGVRNRQTSIFIGLAASVGAIGGTFPHKVADNSYSLVLVLAYSVLQNVLLQLRDEGYFTSKDSRLGPLIHNSEKKLPWIDFGEIDRGRCKRNDVAHNDYVPSRGESWKYVDAIEKELVNWDIIPYQKIDYSIPWGSREQKTLKLS